MTKIIKLTDLKLIGIHGHAGAGKDTISGYLHSKYPNVYGEPFAGPLKAACSEAFGIDEDDFSDPDVKNVVNPYWGVSPRQIAQFVGTEMFRGTLQNLVKATVFDANRYAYNFWINRLAGRLTGALNEYKNHPYVPGDCVVISDVRFQNEYDWIMDNDGIMIHVTRNGSDGNVGISNHASEAGIPNLHTREAYFHIENNGTLEELYSKVDAIVEHHLDPKPDEFPL